MLCGTYMYLSCGLYYLKMVPSYEFLFKGPEANFLKTKSNLKIQENIYLVISVLNGDM